MMQLVRRMTASEMGGYVEILSLHAEGSPQAQRLMIYAESLKGMEEYKKLAEIAAGIEVDSLPDVPTYRDLAEASKDDRRKEWLQKLQELG